MVLTDRTYDTLLELKDAGLVAASAAGTVGGNAKIVDIGDGKIVADLIVKATAVEVASGDEMYEVMVQGSNSDSFASGIVILATLKLGDTVPIGAGVDADAGVGNYAVPFRNTQNGTTYRYVRVYTKVAGTIATGVNYSAFIGLLHND